MSEMKERGDTIIEVLFAVTVFCLVAVGALSLMNQGTAMAQRALEIGLVRAEMDAQADALRYLHNAYIASYGQADSDARVLWKKVTTDREINPSQVQSLQDMTDGDSCKLPPASPGAQSSGDPFVIDIRKLDEPANASSVITVGSSMVDPATYSRIRYYADDQRTSRIDPARPEGIWIQAVHKPLNTSILGYYDFHIRACWFTPGQKAPMTLGTIVRLYDPRGVGEEDM